MISNCYFAFRNGVVSYSWPSVLDTLRFLNVWFFNCACSYTESINFPGLHARIRTGRYSYTQTDRRTEASYTGMHDNNIVVLWKSTDTCGIVLMKCCRWHKTGDHFAGSGGRRLRFVLTTRGQSNLTKSASRGAHSPVRGHHRGSKFVPLNSWGRVSY